MTNKFLKKLFGNKNGKKPISENITPLEEEKNMEVIIDEIVSGITLDIRVETSVGGENFNIGDELRDLSAYDEVELDGETDVKIKELKEITESIESKIIEENVLDENKTYKINYTDELNSNQLAAVTVVNFPLLVIAGAGSGKTRVITYKVSYLIESGLIPSEILLLTFTRKASNEMLERVHRLLKDKSAEGVLGGTFHSFSNYILRKYGNLIGIQANFTIIDIEDTTDIIDLLKTELNISRKKGQRPFPKKRKVQTIISKSKSLELEIPEIIIKYFSEASEFTKEIELIARALIAYKKASNLFDYDDLMIVLRDSLRENKSFRDKLQRSIKYVLVDEYQDTNNTQREIVEFIVGSRGRVTVVGDDSQSIYSFRGANFENILRFPQTYPNCRVVKIEENYRSVQGILNFTNDLIQNAKIGFKKKLYSKRYTGKKPLVKKFPDSTSEAEFIVDKILDIKANDLEFSDFAVLTRANWHSNFIQAELLKRNIKFIVVGGIKFSERRHIKDIVSFLKIILNPMDAVAWHRILKLIEGIGKVRAKEIVEVIHSNNGVIDFSNFSDRKYYKELARLEKQFLKVLDQNLAPSQILEILFKFYEPILKQIEDDYEVRLEDLSVFIVIASKYDDLEKFLSDFTLEPPSNKFQDETVPVDSDDDEKPLVVSTIHSAKGLEWHTVFIPFALDGVIPSVRSIGSIQEIEEERRVFYVATSRAKENLFITMPSYVSSWDAFFTRPSRFIAEIQKDKYEI